MLSRSAITQQCGGIVITARALPRLPLTPADESFEKFASSVKHIACDRTDGGALKAALAGKGFQGE
jgi:hypothetical protein